MQRYIKARSAISKAASAKERRGGWVKEEDQEEEEEEDKEEGKSATGQRCRAERCPSGEGGWNNGPADEQLAVRGFHHGRQRTAGPVRPSSCGGGGGAQPSQAVAGAASLATLAAIEAVGGTWRRAEFKAHTGRRQASSDRRGRHRALSGSGQMGLPVDDCRE